MPRRKGQRIVLTIASEGICPRWKLLSFFRILWWGVGAIPWCFGVTVDASDLEVRKLIFNRHLLECGQSVDKQRPLLLVQWIPNRRCRCRFAILGCTFWWTWRSIQFRNLNASWYARTKGYFGCLGLDIGWLLDSRDGICTVTHIGRQGNLNGTHDEAGLRGGTAKES